jgi:hypothetical protein
MNEILIQQYFHSMIIELEKEALVIVFGRKAKEY